MSARKGMLCKCCIVIYYLGGKWKIFAKRKKDAKNEEGKVSLNVD